MIVVLGRPARARRHDGEALDGTVSGIALALAAADRPVELVGSVGDDAEGDAVVVLLGQAGVGHAALLRDPAGRTPVAGEARHPLPRLDAGDVELGLRYIADVSVLVLAESLAPDAEAAALDAAAYHTAPVVAIVPAADAPGKRLADRATVLEAPEEDAGAFAEVVARYAAGLASGTAPADPSAAAARDAGWERAGG